MPRYRFSETVVYKSGNPWPTYQAGEVYDLPRDHGERWVRRHVATEVEDDSAVLLEPVVEAVIEPPVVAAPEPEPTPEPTYAHTPRLMRNRRP